MNTENDTESVEMDEAGRWIVTIPKVSTESLDDFIEYQDGGTLGVYQDGESENTSLQDKVAPQNISNEDETLHFETKEANTIESVDDVVILTYYEDNFAVIYSSRETPIYSEEEVPLRVRGYHEPGPESLNKVPGLEEAEKTAEQISNALEEQV